MAQDYPVPIPVDAFGGYGGGFGGGFGGYGGGFGGGYGGGVGGGLPYGGLGLALNSVQNQNQMGLFGGAGGQSTLGGGIANSMLNTATKIKSCLCYRYSIQYIEFTEIEYENLICYLSTSLCRRHYNCFFPLLFQPLD